MKKILLLLLLLPMLTSCFTTRYVSEEPVLKKQFMNAHVAAVEFDLGDPDEVRETNRGYEYVYLKDCPPGDCYRLFAFNGEDQVVGIKSTERVKVRRFSASKLIASIFIFFVVTPMVIAASTG